MEIDLSRRASLRLDGFDYSKAGWYYLTVCTQFRKCILGKIVHNRIYLSPLGHIVESSLNEFPLIHPHISIDTHQIMPNHLHAIVQIKSDGRTQRSAPTITISQFVQRFKTFTTRKYIEGIHQYGWQQFNGKLWQRNYYEHIVRDDHDLGRIRNYIRLNPINWHRDKLHSPSP